MAAGLHGSACTTPRVRTELQAAKEGTRALAGRYGLNPEMVAKLRGRGHHRRRPDGAVPASYHPPDRGRGGMVVDFRQRTLLPLDDVLGCLRQTIPALTRSAPHRCLVRHGISRPPRDEEGASKRGRFAETTIGDVHIDAWCPASGLRCSCQ